MKTLIELYDERPLDNVLATEMFKPEETVFVCPPQVAADQALRASLRRYFNLRGCRPKLTFVPVSMLDERLIEASLRKVIATHEDCVIDISGGTDAALFAAGAVSGDTVPVITYSRGKNRFYEIKNAPFAHDVPCTVRLDARSCLMMAGGELLRGREDNSLLRNRLDQIELLFGVYTRYRKIWNDQVAYLQKISRTDDPDMAAEGPCSGRANNRLITLNADLLHMLADRGLIRALELDDENVSFRFADDMVRFWLRDMGSALELHVYRACVLSGFFDDCILSAVVNWQGTDPAAQAVTNEIAVMCVRGVTPLFISCKTCDIKTEALNELAVLRDRFGNKGSRAAIVTAASASQSRLTLKRAAALKIDVIEWQDIDLEKLLKSF